MLIQKFFILLLAYFWDTVSTIVWINPVPEKKSIQRSAEEVSITNL